MGLRLRPGSWRPGWLTPTSRSRAWGLMRRVRSVDQVGVGRLEEQWRRRVKADGETAGPRLPTEGHTVRFQEAARLRHAPGTVWALIHPAECAPLLSSTTARGFKVPGPRTASENSNASSIRRATPPSSR